MTRCFCNLIFILVLCLSLSGQESTYVKGKDYKGYIFRREYSYFVNTEERFIKRMSESSPEFKKAYEAGAQLTINLFACNAGSENINWEGKTIHTSIAKDLSKNRQFTINAMNGFGIFKVDKSENVVKIWMGNDYQTPSWIKYKRGKAVKRTYNKTWRVKIKTKVEEQNKSNSNKNNREEKFKKSDKSKNWRPVRKGFYEIH
jgi:hypothetical protein